jgi:hypothetical protein
MYDDYVTIPKRIADGIEHLADISIKTSPNGKVETSTDWAVLVETYKVWKHAYPNLYSEFIKSANTYRNEYKFNKGMNKEGSAFIQHRLEVPEALHKWWETMFPKIKYDRDFIDRLIKELPEFKIST